MVTVACLDCGQPIELNPNPEIGQRVTCQSCTVELEVTWLFPVCLDYLENTQEIPAYPVD